MKDLLKIKEIGLTKLNNAEYTNYMSRVHAEVVLITAKKIGINQENITSLENNIAKLNDLLAQSRISDNTAKLAELDHERDNIIVYIMAEIDNKQRNPIASVKTAAISLYNATHQYTGIQREADQQETQKINALLADLAKPENATNVTSLGLNEVVAQLKQLNDEYASITSERTEEKTAEATDSSKVIRRENDELYDYITTMAFVTSVAKPSNEVTAFVININAIIDEITTRYNQRRAAEKAHKKEN